MISDYENYGLLFKNFTQYLMHQVIGSTTIVNNILPKSQETHR